MMITNNIATLVTVAALSTLAASAANAGDQYTFPSGGGAQLAATPAPTFTPVQSRAGNVMSISVGGAGYAGKHHVEPPLPPPGFPADHGTPYAGQLMNHALAVAPYSNYAADYARLFAPSYAVTAWTDRVFGIVETGYSAVDGWTAEAYGMRRLSGRRRAETAPDLTLMPAFRPHPELQAPTFGKVGG